MKAFLIGMLAAAVTIAIVFRVQMLRNTPSPASRSAFFQLQRSEHHGRTPTANA